MDGFQSNRINESLDRTISSRSSSLTRRSLILSGTSHPCDDEDMENESVSEAGDIGDRALLGSRSIGSGRFPSHSIDNSIESGSAVPIPEDALLQSFRFRSQDPNLSSNASPVSPLAQDITASLSTYNIVSSSDQKLESEKKLPWLVEYVSCLVHLASFGILGVLTRYLLQKLFGPGEIGATSDHSYMYLDLPSNMVGSFLMGWFGVIFKQDIARFSEHIQIGLTTGYLGSLTTFSGWNQKMIELSVEGRWVFSVLGCVIGLFLVAYSIIFGVETAEGLRWILMKRFDFERKWKMEGGYRSRLVLMVMFSVILATLWSISGSLERNEFHNGGSRAQLWLACLVGPVGVWIRWFLARFNGRGIGKSRTLKWVPFGTLIANVSAACIMAALATMKKVVNTKNCETIASGFQFGLMGCLSTVSTFAAEFHAMRVSKHPWRAYVYATTTILVSFVLGTLIYSVPVWINKY
ncbi:uncharacterized protein LOC124945197 [Impatiens glandulifera]|uniref:uncharacterized protein LOC124945197 n=1 Tax=Impatiens glandulifera TaxID=253017 RepID=UPI001FB19F93|nr:uncharacterized protein LOC124945197 [Impatiens glandulifera]XP_047341544.1 uncharacterized protein LOC124945197 [Impatiens glandulifera]